MTSDESALDGMAIIMLAISATEDDDMAVQLVEYINRLPVQQSKDGLLFLASLVGTMLVDQFGEDATSAHAEGALALRRMLEGLDE